jgi:hypothetical protein
MFCPQCKAEYRQGFTRCADCDVDLVESLPRSEESVSQVRPGGDLTPLWEGDDLALHTTLLEELESAGIRYFDQAMSVFPGARRGDHFPIQPLKRFGYQAAILSSDLTEAREILEKLLKEDRGNRILPEDETKEPGATKRVAALDETATCEVWAGQDKDVAGFLKDALQENGLVIKAEIAGAETKIFVRPSDEARARRIVREIEEGAAPE